MLRLNALALALLVEGVTVLAAQSTSATLAGRVTDPSKAVIAAAKVAGINTSTGIEYDTRSNASGDYALPDLPPGTYRLEVERNGFKKLIKPDVVLHVQDALKIDFEMSGGGGHREHHRGRWSAADRYRVGHREHGSRSHVR